VWILSLHFPAWIKPVPATIVAIYGGIEKNQNNPADGHSGAMINSNFFLKKAPKQTI
jgi:hypothetical protein